MVDDEGIKQIGRNTHQVRVKRIDQRTGRQVNRKATVTGTKADAIRVRNQIRDELASTASKRPRIRLSEFAASWIEQRQRAGLKASTLRRYGFSLEWIVPALGDLYLDAISPADVREYIATRMKNKAAGNTVLNELRCLRTMAGDALNDRYCDQDWCARVPAPKVARYTKANPNLLNAKQFEDVIEAIPKQWRGLVLFIVTTGLRWGEASALHWEDVDFKAGEATISHSNDRGTIVTVKNESSYRTVPVVAEVAALWGLKRQRGLVFPTRRGVLHRGSPLIKVLKKACLVAKVPRVTTHGLRRTFNNLARQMTSQVVLKSITGHTTDKMVEHYSFVDHSEKLTASRAVAKSIGLLKKKVP